MDIKSQNNRSLVRSTDKKLDQQIKSENNRIIEQPIKNSVNSTYQKINQQIKKWIRISKVRAKFGSADKKLD